MGPCAQPPVRPAPQPGPHPLPPTGTGSPRRRKRKPAETRFVPVQVHRRGSGAGDPRGDPGDGWASADGGTTGGAAAAEQARTIRWDVPSSTTIVGAGPDSEQPSYFGTPYQVHDGAVDVTNGSDLVTLSFNRFTGHDELMLIGSTGSPTRRDPGRLRVSVHHNVFEDVGQRAPRVRCGRVDVYNNHYVVPEDGSVPCVHSLGAGIESHLYAEAEQLAHDTSWTPALRTRVHAARAVPAVLARTTGPVLSTGGDR